MLTPMAWAFTCLNVYGVWRYLKKTDKVTVRAFLLSVFYGMDCIK